MSFDELLVSFGELSVFHMEQPYKWAKTLQREDAYSKFDVGGWVEDQKSGWKISQAIAFLYPARASLRLAITK